MTDRPTVIRSLEQEDLPARLTMMQALAAHHNDACPNTIAQMERDMIASPTWIRVLVAQSGPALIGYTAVLPLANINKGLRGLDINHLYVAASYRSQGVGRALLDAAIALGRELQCTYAFITADPENTRAHTVYQTYGFEPWSTENVKFRYIFPAKDALN